METLKTNLIFTILSKLPHIEHLLIKWDITLTTLKANTLLIQVMSTQESTHMLVQMHYQYKYALIRIIIKIGHSKAQILMNVLDKLVIISCKMILLEQLDSYLDSFLLSLQLQLPSVSTALRFGFMKVKKNKIIGKESQANTKQLTIPILND